MTFLMLLAAEVSAIPPTPAIADQIVVIGRKMKAWRGSVAKRDGRIECRTYKTSKDREIDAMRCETMVACTAPLDAAISRIMADTSVPMAERRKRFDALLQTTLPCVQARDEAAMRALAERRARA